MCGIAGFTHRNQFVTRHTIQKAISLLSHRGPDDQGTHFSPHCSIGAARLKIVDLRAGRQPMYDESGNTVLAFNGEIYNYVELREELERLGHRFISHSDTEVVLHAFLEWDTDSFSRLRGMFAIALWSELEDRLILARDRLGIKPLYICRRRSDIYFASELKAILVHPEIDRRLSMDGLNLFLTMNYVPGKHTLVEGIDKLTPGSWLEWRAGKVREEVFWKLRMEPREEWTLAGARSELDRLMRRSVREHLVADVPAGIWLSGGLDSSAMLHYAAEESLQPLRTFSITFRGRSFDESRYIRQIAEHYGTEHHELDLNPQSDLRDAIEDLTYYADEPCADSSALPVWFLSRLTKQQHVRVALTGDGADELFGGYATYTADRIARYLRRLHPSLLRAAATSLRAWPVSNEKVGMEYCVKRLFAGSLMPEDEAHVYWNGTFSHSERSALFSETDEKPLLDLFRNSRSGTEHSNSLASFFNFDQNYYLTDDILCKVDRMSMAHSVEVRPPFLDHRIVEFSASLPDSLKIKGLQQKRVLRELMKNRLPAPIVNRKKIGFDIPTHDWFRGILRPLLFETLTRKAVSESGIFEWKTIDSLVHSHLNRRANLGFHLWGLVTFFQWMKRWKVEFAGGKEGFRKCVSIGRAS
jgi:asparagine synthase (glutamine-hydrolysing)